jgi:hypothetical protein
MKNTALPGLIRGQVIVGFENIFGPTHLFLLFHTQAMYFKSFKYNGVAMV